MPSSSFSKTIDKDTRIKDECKVVYTHHRLSVQQKYGQESGRHKVGTSLLFIRFRNLNGSASSPHIFCVSFRRLNKEEATFTHQIKHLSPSKEERIQRENKPGQQHANFQETNTGPPEKSTRHLTICKN